MLKGHSIYLISGSPGRFFKIGTTTRDVDWRLFEIQCSCPLKLSIVKSYRTDLALEIERAVKRQFQEQHVRGEWFKFNKQQEMDVLRFIDDFMGVI